MSNLNINIGDIENREASFWNTFGDDNRVYFEGDILLDISIEDFNSFLKVFTGRDSHGKHIYVLKDGTFSIGGIEIFHLSYEDGLVRVSLRVLALPDAVSYIEDFLFRNTYKKTNKDGVYDIDITHYYKTNTGMNSIYHSKDTSSFNSVLDEMYPSVDVENMMSLYYNSTESLLILTGAPGTGKTCLAKKCIAEHSRNLGRDINVIYIKDPDILKNDGFWASLTGDRPDMIILDDLDDELLPRSEGRNPIVNNILSFSDGIFDLDTKIVITTNQPNSSIDTALVRPGRCFDILSLPLLSYAEASNIWVNTLKGDLEGFTNKFLGLDSISQAYLVSEYARWSKSKTPSYLKDPSISIRASVEAGLTVNT